MSAKRAAEIEVGERIKFEAPRVQTPGVSQRREDVPGGTVANPSRVTIEARVEHVESLGDGRLRFDTDRKVSCWRKPDDRVLVI